MAETAIQILRRVSKAVKAGTKGGKPPGLVSPQPGLEEAAKRVAQETTEREAMQLLERAAGKPGAAAVRVPGTPARTVQPPTATAGELQAVEAGIAAAPTEGRIPGINLNYVQAPDQVKQLEASILARASEDLQKAQRGKRGHDVTQVAAAKLLASGKVNPAWVVARETGTAFANAETQIAAKELRDAAANELADLLMNRAKGVVVPDEQILGMFAWSRALGVQVAAAITEGARLLESGKITTGAKQAARVKVGELAGRLPEGITPDRLVSMGVALDSKRAISEWAKGSLVLGKDLTWEVWINGLLSGPVTHISNIVSTGSMAWTMVERGFAGNIAGPIREMLGGVPGVQRGEVIAQTFGIWAATGDALRLMGPAFAGESAFGGAAKMIPRTQAFSAASFGFAPESQIGFAADFIGNYIVRAPGGAMRSVDELYKGLWYRAELYAQAWRTAKLESIADPKVFGARVADLILNPTPQMQVAALDFAKVNTFTKELGTSGLHFMQWANSTPMMRVLLPFISTPVNSGKQAFQRFPILNLASETNLRDFAAGGAQADLAMARVATSGLIAYYFGGLAASGLITGAGTNYSPKFKAWLRDQGWKPYARFDPETQTYVSFRREEPGATAIGAVADFVERFQNAPDQDIASGAGALVAALSRSIADQSMLTGIVRAADAVHGPGLKRMIHGTAQSVVPFSGAVRQVSRAFDSTFKEVYSVWDAMAATWQSASLYPHLGDDGYPIIDQTPLPLINIRKRQQFTDEPYAKEFAALGLAMRPLPRALWGSAEKFDPSAPTGLEGGVTLSAEQRHRLGELRGHEVTDKQGRSLIQALNDEVQSDRFRRIPIPALEDRKYSPRTHRLNKIVDDFHDEAISKLVDEFDDIRSRRDILFAERQAVKRGQPIPSRMLGPAEELE